MKLPVCSGKEAVRAFERAGWNVDRQRGSHVSLFRGRTILLCSPFRCIENWIADCFGT